MLLRINKYTCLIFAVLLFSTAAIFENWLLHKHPEQRLIHNFQVQLVNNEKNITRHIEKISTIVSSDNYIGDLYSYIDKEKLKFNKHGIGFLVFRNGELEYWSDRSIAFYDNLIQIPNTDGLLTLPNGYYLAKSISAGKHDIIGLQLIKNNYRYTNKFLKNAFSRNYKLPVNYNILEENKDGTYPVYDSQNKYLFSILSVGQILHTNFQLFFIGITYLLGLIFLLFYFRRELLENNSPFFFKLFALAVILFTVYWFHLIFKIPKVFYELQFFSPEDFALSNWLPSLGDYFLFSLFLSFWMYNFTYGLNIDVIHKKTKISYIWIIYFLFLVAGSTYLLINFYIEELISSPTISFSINKITEITEQSVLGIFSISLFLFSILYFAIKIGEQARKYFRFRFVCGIILSVCILLLLLQYVILKKVNIPVLFFFMVSSLLAVVLNKNYIQKFKLSYIIIFVSVVSLYSLYVFFHSNTNKERILQESLAVMLVTERDPAVEVFISGIQKRILADSIINNIIMEVDEDTPQKLNDYLRQTYFNNYYQRYLFNSYYCSMDDSLEIMNEGRMVHCFTFFDDMIESQGTLIPGTNFYFMDNMNGRISYTGRLNINGALIFIELNSNLLFEDIGFPELLIDKTMMKPDIFKKFSYAKYYSGELTDKYGDYNYNYYVDSYLFSDEEFSTRRWDGMEHLIYHTRENNYVIVSRELFTVVDYLISLPYLFVFYMMFLMFFFLSGKKITRSNKIIFNLKLKIQTAIISIVFISLLLVAVITIFYNLDKYRTKHLNDLNEKMKSISKEIDLRLAEADEISFELETWLNMELPKLSNIFGTDINIYDTGGKIIASSRIEIFDQGLISSRINDRAFYEISENYQLNYFQTETIGQFSYLSAYQPIVNYRGNYLGFINLPYFIRQDNYSQEISTFIVAFINLYVLLFMASIVVAVFISNQITRPLVLMQENIQKIQLRQRNEPIQYKRNDEIGNLVKEYNKKVDELSASAELLARSERESAWREMAKQVAHEIKNPLTPMKLNIQYLKRAKNEGEDFKKHVERVSAILIEQIDNLSNIVTEFSNFANIPTARNQVFLLVEQLKNIIALFETHEHIDIKFYSNQFENIKVNADREQFSRALINLLKNAIQAIPEGQNGKIDVTLNRRENMAIISITDNGTGIPEELHEKLFSPGNFTTKKSGMGLGLTIVKNIVKNFSGKIRFETVIGEGTTFYIEIPVYE
ncbi:MAG: sensor histidine kinase [Bacteroidales bacterium]|jgi:signal transduction histidine kinase|nr:sensor histidine kinase [Bacteroidales bacterium]